MLARLRPLYSTLNGVTAVVLIAALVLLAIIGPIVWGAQAEAIDVGDAWLPPSPEHLLGTDDLGRDLFARAMAASRLSLGSAAVASLIGIAIGVPIGVIASAFGPRMTNLFRGVISVLIAFPALLTAMFVGTIIGIGIPGAVLGVGIALAPMFARLTQTLTASVAALDYVAAARTMGVNPFLVIGRHILPNVAEPLIITATTSVGISLLGISALSFLGLGARPPEFDWGGLLSSGLDSVYFAPLAALAPAALIAIAGIAFSLLGEAIAGAFSDGQTTRRSSRVARRMAVAQRRRRAGIRPAEPRAAGLLLDVEDLVVEFPSDAGPVRPVRGVTLSMRPGDRTGIVGESGSGKSITVMAIAQLVDYPGTVQATRLEFLGRDLRTMPAPQLRTFLGTTLAMVFQNPMSALNPALRIGGQVSELARVHRRLSRRAATALAVEKLEEVGIPDARRRLRQYPHEFSGGMRQRAMIAMGLTESPALIIADEPTTALDVTVQHQILELLKRINREEGSAILLISHDIAVIADTCDRVVVMYAGRVVEDLPTSSLLGEAAHPYTRALIGAVPEMDTDRTRELATIPGRPPLIGEDPPGCAFADRCPIATAKCRAERPPLEAVGEDHRAACWHPQHGLPPSGPALQPAGEAGR